MVKLAAAKLFVTHCFCLNIAISAIAKKMNSTNTISIPPITRVTDKSSLSSLKEENFRRQRFFCGRYLAHLCPHKEGT